MGSIPAGTFTGLDVSEAIHYIDKRVVKSSTNKVSVQKLVGVDKGQKGPSFIVFHASVV